MTNIRNLCKHGKNGSPDKNLQLFKRAVENLMNNALKIISEMEMNSTNPEMEDYVRQLKHTLKHTKYLCESRNINKKPHKFTQK